LTTSWKWSPVPDIQRTVRVHAERTYDVVVGRDLGGVLPAMLDGAQRVALIHAPPLRERAGAISEALGDAGLVVSPIEVPDAESAKTARVLATCWDALGSAGLTRSDAVIGLGGGATTDLAGFVAATWLRGVRVVHMPTTLLGMVDAAVGGKTGINTAAGKNLVGSFWSPAGVLCDLDALSSLPRDELVPGMAEIVKIGFVRDPGILDVVLADPTRATDPAHAELLDVVVRAIQVKADVVAADFTEDAGSSGQLGREVLNYGHTFGHAIERCEGYQWRHGSAVAVGMVYVAELARIGGLLSEGVVALHREVLEALGLPTRFRDGRWNELHAAMSLDKKARGSLLRFVVLRRVAEPEIWAGPEPAVLEAAYAAIVG
jgi:3-dehydroquinate synthase